MNSRQRLLIPQFFIFFLIICTLNFISGNIPEKKPTELKFPKYPYKRHSGLENRFYARFNKCSQTELCLNVDFEEKQNCILQCISEKCYGEIYAWNPLEEGELDLRQNSYKGCLKVELGVI